MLPKKLQVKKNKFLQIYWDDNSESLIELKMLRDNCPCAICAAERKNQSDLYIPLKKYDELKIVDLKMIGNYAIGITWADGHNTGIYDFALLKDFAEMS